MSYQIIPALLTDDFETFRSRLKAVEPYFPLVQIDIADGEFVPVKNFADPTSISRIKTSVQYELHLMVAHPLAYIEAWKDAPNVRRVIFHVESKDDPREAIERILFYGFDAGIALNTETKTNAIEPHLDRVETVLFLGVRPGRSGAPFIPETIDKIRNFINVTLSLSKGNMGQRPKVAVDGGVSHETIPALKAAGAEVFCMSSELFEKHATVGAALAELKELLA